MAVVTVMVLAASPNVFGENGVYLRLSQSRSGVAQRPTGRPALQALHGFLGPLYHPPLPTALESLREQLRSIRLTRIRLFLYSRLPWIRLQCTLEQSRYGLLRLVTLVDPHLHRSGLQSRYPNLAMSS